jgi:hypothetical protein
MAREKSVGDLLYFCRMLRGWQARGGDLIIVDILGLQTW